MATRKPWDEHSERWKRRAIRDGLDPRRWNAWRNLSPKTRAQTDPRRYAQGESVHTQHVTKLRQSVVAGIMNAKAGDPKLREFTVRRGVQMLSTRELQKMSKMTTGVLSDYITKKARQPVPTGQRNPYWYR
jgi:hypothetical protein